jgi:predicted RNase H-like HicB family nuclease
MNECKLFFEDKIPAVVVPTEGAFCAYSPMLRGCNAQGDTVEEVLKDFEGALKELLACYKDEKMPIPWSSVCTDEIQEKGTIVFFVDLPQT